MKACWPATLGILLVLASIAHAQAPRLGAPVSPLAVGYLHSDHPEGKAIRYEPQPGDIILYDDFNRFYHFIFKIAGTSAPTHTAMVVTRPDGTIALLELTGPTMVFAKVVVMDVETRFKNYGGTIMVRRVRTPLTPDQCHDLTRFAQAESGKSFALGRVILQGTPFCPRTGLRRALFGKTYESRSRWFCSEIVVAGCASARVLDGKAHCANATVPRDLAFDETIDLSRSYHPAMLWHATPAR
jgi:hypothetical protein